MFVRQRNSDGSISEFEVPDRRKRTSQNIAPTTYTEERLKAEKRKADIKRKAEFERAVQIKAQEQAQKIMEEQLRFLSGEQVMEKFTLGGDKIEQKIPGKQEPTKKNFRKLNMDDL